MSSPLNYQIGMDGFVWFVGVVESMSDPLNAGRCKVRIFGWHDKDTDNLSTDDLPWAVPVLPVTAATMLPNYRPGDWVMGFFMDAHLGQQPYITGVFPSIAQR